VRAQPSGGRTGKGKRTAGDRDEGGQSNDAEHHHCIARELRELVRDACATARVHFHLERDPQSRGCSSGCAGAPGKAAGRGGATTQQVATRSWLALAAGPVARCRAYRPVRAHAAGGNGERVRMCTCVRAGAARPAPALPQDLSDRLGGGAVCAMPGAAGGGGEAGVTHRCRAGRGRYRVSVCWAILTLEGYSGMKIW
jgi:hypothetical protein